MDAIFLKIEKETVDGDSEVKGYENWIEVLSFSHGVAAQLTGDVSNQNRTSGRPVHQDMTITKFADKGTPKLNEHCCKGTVFEKMTLVVGRNDKGDTKKFLEYTMKDVVIGSVSIGGGGGGKPVETLSLNYVEMEWIYYLQDDKGGTKKASSGKWSLRENKSA